MISAFTSKHHRSKGRFGAVILLALMLALAAVAPQSGQAAEVAPSIAGTAAVFGPAGPITFPDVSSPPSGPGNPFPSTIDVSGLGTSLTTLTVTLTSFDHPRPDDFDILLVGPDGTSILLMSDACNGTNPIGSLTFQDGAAPLPDSGTCADGTYAPSNYPGGADHVDDDKPNGIVASATTLSAFDGTNPNGTWSLYVLDDESGSGRDASVGGWSLDITATAVNQPPVLTDIPDQNMTLGDPPLALTITADDPEDDPLTYGASSSDPAIVSVSLAGNVLTLNALATGTATITVTVNDGINPDVPDTFEVLVLAPGEPTPIPPTEPPAEPTEEVVVYTAAQIAAAQAPLCADLSGQTNPVIRASVPADAVTNGNVYCRVLAENGVFPNPIDSARVGDPGLIEYGVLHAVDVFGVTADGLAYPAFNHTVTVCLQGTGRFIYLSALNSPRTTYEPASFAQGGYTCATIPAAGTVVLIPAAPMN